MRMREGISITFELQFLSGDPNAEKNGEVSKSVTSEKTISLKLGTKKLYPFCIRWYSRKIHLRDFVKSLSLPRLRS